MFCLSLVDPSLERGRHDCFTSGIRKSSTRALAGLSGASHAVYVSRPKEVAALIEEAYRVQKGRISDNWHLEDNISLMQQLGVVKPR